MKGRLIIDAEYDLRDEPFPEDPDSTDPDPWASVIYLAETLEPDKEALAEFILRDDVTVRIEGELA